MNKQNKITAIMDLCDESGAEIISFGLAPNPFGFCFERSEETTDAQAQRLSRLLDSLSSKEEQKLRGLLFGGSNE